jgi:type VI secretion system protein ImpF
VTTAPQTQAVPCLFDRLTDLEPRVRRDQPLTSWEQMEQLKQAVARDLTNLLNTRRSEADIPEEFKKTNESVAAYGIEDFTSSPVNGEQMRRAIDKSIRIFEPRLSHVSVQMRTTGDFELEFRIVAMLRVDVRSEPVVFDTILPKHSRRFRVVEGR